ncbi:hypothetical protein SNOG_12443 [Parastagonospora nodorum SN15]|uniref:Major facilitator superfamily (MFS) profile domain-containing protein n=1 Tax=Phaeosphaeria nodorum (strain SN15 / ATCC MYA-4574 / FGSC 10173) TaxID=321614 RepID=Q0U721_PHANO|nr:hypothetical protein SNOG_12443 [Parastagonospora nodorum SN15]EAT80256.2 hypothetical protein SNOG_12443 [Parastagonospora nodorum SN15]
MKCKSLNLMRSSFGQHYRLLSPPRAAHKSGSVVQGFWRSFVAICIPLLLSALEGSVTNTALPHHFGCARPRHQVLLGRHRPFLLASTIFQPLYSQLGDMWGRKYPMMLAVLVFAVGSAICGAANSGAVLIFGRIVQGLGTGGIDLFAEMILCDIIPLRKRGPYLAIKHVTFAIGTTLGPLLGGVFAEHGWRWCFLVNIPICGISLVVIWFYLNVGRGANASDVKLLDELKKIDYIGSSILTASVVMLLVALSTGGAPNPWSHPAVVLPLMFGLMGLIAFICWERSPYCKHPIMPPQIFSNRTTNIAFTLTTIHGFVTYGFQFYLPPFFQAVQGSSPTKSGLQVMPTTLVVVVLAAVGGPLLSFWGFALMTLGPGAVRHARLHDALPAHGCLSNSSPPAGFGIVISTMLPAVQGQAPRVYHGRERGLVGVPARHGIALRRRGSWRRVQCAFRAAAAVHILPNSAGQTRAWKSVFARFVEVHGEVRRKGKGQRLSRRLRCRSGACGLCLPVVAGVGFLMTWGEKEYKMRKSLDTVYGLKPPKGGVGSKTTSGASTPEGEKVVACGPKWGDSVVGDQVV